MKSRKSWANSACLCAAWIKPAGRLTPRVLPGMTRQPMPWCRVAQKPAGQTPNPKSFSAVLRGIRVVAKLFRRWCLTDGVSRGMPVFIGKAAKLPFGNIFAPIRRRGLPMSSGGPNRRRPIYLARRPTPQKTGGWASGELRYSGELFRRGGSYLCAISHSR